jgi:MFS family permease
MTQSDDAGDDAAGCLPSRAQWQGRLLGVVTGVIFGLGLGFISMYLYYDHLSKDCSRLRTAPACAAAAAGRCVWSNHSTAAPAGQAAARCLFPDFATINCTAAATATQCGAAGSECVFDYDNLVCYHAAGLSPLETGLFAGAPALGATVGSVGGGYILRVLSYRATLAAIAATLLVACLATTVARAVDSVGLMIAFRVVFGVAMAAPRVVAPLFIFRTMPVDDAGGVVATIQPMTSLGMAITFVFAFVVAPVDFSQDTNMETRIHFLVALQWLGSLGFAVVAFLMTEPQTPEEQLAEVRRQPVELVQQSPDEHHSAYPAVRRRPVNLTVSVPGEHMSSSAAPIAAEDALELAQRYEVVEPCALLRYLLIGATVAMGFVGTGLPIVTAYTPRVSQDLVGLPPIIAPMLLSAVSVPSGFVAMAVKGRISARNSMLVGATVLALCDLLIGVATLPGVIDDALTRYVLTGIGFVLFLFTVEVFVGSTFFELAVAIMPRSIARMGSGIVSAVVNVIGLLQTVLFPTVVVALSGGPTGNQRTGIGICFIALCVMGLVAVAILTVTMFPHREVIKHFQPWSPPRTPMLTPGAGLKPSFEDALEREE